MDFLKKNKPVAIGIGVVVLGLVLFLAFGRGGAKEEEKEEEKPAGRTGRRVRRNRPGRRTRPSARKTTSRAGGRKPAAKKKPKKKKRKINLRLSIDDLPRINNKELITARERGELTAKYGYTFKYNPYEDWEVRIYLSDLDGDGIPDSSDPDIDDDGYSNEQERLAGTDPYDYRSRPEEKPEDKKIETETEVEEKVELTSEEKKRLLEEKRKEEEKKRWDTIVKSYNYKGTMGMKNSRLAIFKEANTGEVLLRRLDEKIPGTKYKVSRITNNSVILLDTASGKEKELVSKTEAEEKTRQASSADTGTAADDTSTAAETTVSGDDGKSADKTDDSNLPEIPPSPTDGKLESLPVENN